MQDKAATGPVPAKPKFKAELIRDLAERNDLPRPKVEALLEDIAAIAEAELKGVGKFTIPGLVTLKLARRAATAEKQGRNPANGKPMTITAKPARNVLKAHFAKALRDSV